MSATAGKIAGKRNLFMMVPWLAKAAGEHNSRL
jgi:hypothetical protein